jgi:hypothetical protein
LSQTREQRSDSLKPEKVVLAFFFGKNLEITKNRYNQIILIILKNMGIKSSKQEPQRIIEPKQKDIDFAENSLRPKTLQDYVGQEQLKKHLSVSIVSAKMRKASLEHILFYGPP